jgi:hypothetical protein
MQSRPCCSWLSQQETAGASPNSAPTIPQDSLRRQETVKSLISPERGTSLPDRLGEIRDVPRLFCGLVVEDLSARAADS